MAKRGLGRGVGAIIPDYDENFEAGGAVELKIIDVEPNADQPRNSFDKEKLDELAESVATHGVIQPILVAKDGDHYKIIAGERRWRAAKIAGLKTIPAIVRDYEAEKLFVVSMIENLQREDLNPVEEASGYKTLLDKFGMTQEKVSESVGKSRSTVANSLRILSLPEDVVEMLRAGAISTGHAKVILSLPTAELRSKSAVYIAEKKLSVRESEAYIAALTKPPREEPPKENNEVLLQIEDLETNISKVIGTKVKIRHGNGKGKIEIQYYSNDDLERILDFFKN